MRYQAARRTLVHLLTLLSLLLSLLPSTSLTPRAVAAAPAPSTQAEAWPAPALPDLSAAEPFLDPVSQAITQALGSSTEPASLAAQGSPRLEPLAPSRTPQIQLPQAEVTSPAAPAPQAALNATQPAPSSRDALAHAAALPQDEQPAGSVADPQRESGLSPPAANPVAAPAAAPTLPAAGPPAVAPQASPVLSDTVRRAISQAVSRIYLPLVSASNGNVPPPPTLSDQALITPAQGGTLVSADGRLRLEVPAGAVTQPVTVTYRTLAPQAVAGFQSAGVFFELRAVDASGQPVRHFDKLLTLRVRYADQVGLDEARLKLYFTDAEHPAWTALASAVEPQANVVVAQSDHFTTFGVLGGAIAQSTCEAAGAGQGAPDQATRQAFIDACEDYTLAVLVAVKGNVYTFGGAAAQDFDAGTLLRVNGTFYYLQPEYVAKYKAEGGPAGWLGAPQTEENPTQAPATFTDENGHNFVGQDVLFLEKGFISKNGGSVEAHRYFPNIPGLGQISVKGTLKEYDPPVSGDPKIQKIKLDFATGVDPAPKYSSGASVRLTLTVEAEGQQPWSQTIGAGPSSQTFAYPYELDPGTPVSFSYKAARVTPDGDNLVGYAPCTAFTQNTTYPLNAQEGTFTFENTCEGADGNLPPPDTTPPTIHYVDIFQDGLGGVEVRTLVTDNRAVASVELTFNGTSYSLQDLGGGIYAVAIPNGPTSGDNSYLIRAVDTSNNEAYFPSSKSPLKIPASQAGNFGWPGLCPSCAPDTESQGYQGGAGDPVNTFNGNYTDGFLDLAVAGVGATTLHIQRAYNSLATFGSGGGTMRFTEEGGTIKREVIAGPPQYFGRAWTFPYAVRLLVVDNLLMQGAQIFYPDGRVVSFRRSGAGFEPITPFSFDVLTATGGGYELRHKRTLEVEVFDAEGRLVGRRDRNGNAITLSYDGERLARVENASGRALTFEYNGDGFITTIHAPESKTLTYAYTDGDLTSFTDARGKTTVYTYSDEHQLTEITSPQGHPALRMAYDDQHRVKQQTVGATERYTFSYSDDRSLTTVTDSYSQPTKYFYDEKGRLTQMQDALSFSEFYGYDNDFNRTSFTDRAGRVYTYTYDDRGNRLTEDGPLGWHRAWAYNDLDLVTRAEDAAGRATSFTYDARGNLTAVKNAAGDTSTITYESRGLPIEVRDFNTNTTTNTYDATTGDLLTTTNGAGDTVGYTYDGLGRTKTMTNGRGFTYRYSYDGNDNLLLVEGPLGYQLRYGYDKNDNQISLTDPNGGVSTFTYDASERLVAQANQLGFTTTYGYDEMGNLTRVEDVEKRVWTFDYDAVYNRIAEHGPEDTHTLYTYNAVRMVTDITRCNSALSGGSCAVNQVQHLVYDDLDRVITSVANHVPGAPASADTNVTTTYAYDKVGNLLSLSDANGNATRYTYDALDRLIRQEDAAQQVTTFAYDAMDNLVQLVNPRGYATTFSYDGANRLSTHTDARSQTLSYAYDHNGNLVTQTDPQGIVTRYAYDELDRLVALTENAVDGAPATSEQNVTTRYAYDLAGNLRFVHDPRGGYVTEHRYDAAHRRVLTLDAEGGQTVFAYDKVDNLVSVTDANGHTTTTTYDGLNRRVRVTNPESHHVDFVYDRLGNLLTLTDARGNPSSYQYDGMNRVVVYTDAEGGIWRYSYDAMGNLLVEDDANRHADTFSYDKVYRLLSRTDAEGYITAFTYDPNGNKLTLTDGNGHVTTFSYDELDRRATRTNAEGETTSYAYNWRGDQTAMTEADGVVTGYAYDPLYRLASVTLNQRPGIAATVDTNVVTRYRYDEVGNLVEIVDGNGHPTRFSFDGLNRLTREVDALGNTWDYGYDKTFNRTSRIDALRHRTDYTYYPDDQLQQIRYFDGTTVAYTYDANNNRLTMVDHLGTSTWAYDKLNRVTEVVDVFSRRLGYAYDAVGNRTSLTYADGRAVSSAYYRNDWLKTVTDPEGNVTRYTRDGVGQMTRTENPNSTVSEATYDQADRLLTLVNRQTVGATTTNSAFTYIYDEVSQRTRMVAEYGWRNPRVVTSDYRYDPLRRLVRDADSQGIWTAYSFDAVGNRLSLTTNDDSESPRPFDEKTLVYTYNAINQLLTVVGNTHPGSPGLKRTDNVAQALHAFLHEVAAQQNKGIGGLAAADLLAQADALLADLYGTPEPKVPAVAGAIAALRAQVEAYQAQGAFVNGGIATSLLAKLKLGDEANNSADSEIQTTTFSYDANGNRINKEYPGPQGPRVQGTDYAYDPENRLVAALDYQQNLQGNRVDRAVTRPDYDGAGRRLVKVYDPKDAGGGAKRVEYVFDGLDPVAEYNLWNPQYENFYRGELGRIIEMQHFPSGTQGQMFWYHYDGLGSVAGLTKQSGQSSHNYRYEPYGQIEVPPGNFSDPHNRYTFTGQEWDEHTGLYDFFARAYDPDTGTWLTQDPMRGLTTVPASLHRYGYVHSNPVNHVDVHGYALPAIIIAVIAISEVIDYGWTAYDAVVAGQTIADPHASDEEKIVAGFDLFLAGSLELVEPDDALPGGVPLDDVGRKLLVKQLDDIIKKDGKAAAIEFAHKKFGDKAYEVLDSLGIKYLREQTANNFRHNLKMTTRMSDDAIKDLDAHHMFPQAFRDEFKELGINIDSPYFGAWWKKGEHQKFSHEYNQVWRDFLDGFKAQGRKPTNSELMKFAEELAKRYGLNWSAGTIQCKAL